MVALMKQYNGMIEEEDHLLTAIDVIKMDLHRELLHLRMEKIISREICLLKEQNKELITQDPSACT